jgi:hypothetical protein
METIEIPVDEDVAKAYREANPIDRQNLQLLVNNVLKQTIKSRSLDEIITDMQSQANANGLTQEILDEILQDE